MTAQWKPLNEPPIETGTYIVAHRGRVFGRGYYISLKDYDPVQHNQYVQGWNLMPAWGPTHWLKGEPEFDPLECAVCNQHISKTVYTDGVNIKESK